MNEAVEDIPSKITTTFRIDIVKETLKSQFANPKNKMTDEALDLLCEISKALVMEAAFRSAKQASLENKTVISLEHVESIIPQLMMDFP